MLRICHIDAASGLSETIREERMRATNQQSDIKNRDDTSSRDEKMVYTSLQKQFLFKLFDN